MTPALHRPDLSPIGQSAFMEVLAAFPPLAATPRAPSAQTSVPAPDQLAATVHLKGSRVSGTVRVLLPLPFVARAVKQLTGLDGIEGVAVHEDATGEIANMVAGRVAAKLAAEGYACTLGTPSVSRNASLSVANEPGLHQGRADLLCGGHCLFLEIQCRYLAQ
jgi:CheY-specific phosphatase CheX